MKHGFTLIELLVVVLIIGILTAAALPQYQTAVEKSRAAEAVILSRAIAEAERRYFLANGVYAQDVTLLDMDIPGTVASYPGGTPSIQTKNFICRPKGGDWKEILSLCNRLPAISFYAIGQREDNGKMVCRPYNAKGEKLCKKMGSKNGNYYEW